MAKTRKQKGSAMPQSYLNPNYVEPSGPSGSNVSGAEPGLARASLNLTGGRRRVRNRHMHSHSKKKCGCTKGGFYPSVMGNFVANAARLIPAAVYAGYRMLRNTKTKKHRK